MTARRVALCFLILAGMVLYHPKTAAAKQQDSGTCGSTASWSVDQATKVLTIHGTGAITERISYRNTADFYDSGIEQIVIEEGITSIDANRPFLYLQDARKIVLPDSLRRISATAFYELRNVRTITIPKNVTEIGEAVFMKDYSLEKIHVASANRAYCSVDGVLYTKAGDCLVAFPPAKKVQDGIFVVPEEVREIAPLAFSLQQHIREVILPGSLRELGGGAFFGSSLEKINLQDTAISELPDFNGKEIGLPNEWYLNDVEYTMDTEPQEEWYYLMGTLSRTSIKTLRLPDRVQEISTWCISGTAIQKLYLGSAYIGSINDFSMEGVDDQYAAGTLIWEQLSWLEQVKVAEDNPRYRVQNGLLCSKDGTVVYAIPSRARQREDIILDPAVREIAPYAFENKGNLRSVTCQGSLVSIGEYAFYNSSIEEFEVTGDIGFIERLAFYQSRLTKFTVTGDVYSIGEYAFQSCEDLRDAGLHLGTRLYEVANTAFKHWIPTSRIREILVPNLWVRDTVRLADPKLFERCPSLQNMYFPPVSWENPLMRDFRFSLCKRHVIPKREEEWVWQQDE